jgi:hypothetical protein
MRGHAEIMGEQGVQEGTKHTLLRGHRVVGQRGGCVVSYPYHLGPAHQEVQDSIAEWGDQSQVPWLGDELGGDYCVEHWDVVSHTYFPSYPNGMVLMCVITSLSKHLITHNYRCECYEVIVISGRLPLSCWAQGQWWSAWNMLGLQTGTRRDWKCDNVQLPSVFH